MSIQPQKAKIVFMGTSSFSVAILEALAKNGYNVQRVYTKPDAKTGREQNYRKSAAKEWAEKAGLPVSTPEKIDEEVIKEIGSINADLIIVAAYGRILPKEVLSMPKYGSLNVHASLLPKFRGPSPVQNTLLRGEKETGVTIMLMDEGIDTGEIIAQKKVEIGPDEVHHELSQKLSLMGADLLVETLPLWLDKKIKPQPQDNSQAIICQLIERHDGKINWEEEAGDIYNRYRAFNPWPGIYTFWKKNEKFFRLKMTRISWSNENPDPVRSIGEIFPIGEKIAVQTAKGVIILEEIQAEGRNKMSIDDFLRGAPDLVGGFLR